MSGKYPPLKCKTVQAVLSYLGFHHTRRKFGSHEQWIKDADGKRFKVTVDCTKAPFSQTLIGYMANQAGISKKDFYQISRKL